MGTTESEPGAEAQVKAKAESEPNLGKALRTIASHPFAALITAWNWKAAAISALLRATMFFFTNLRAGGHSAVRAMLVEAAFATIAAGLMGAITQRLRAARPIWATALVVWLTLPTLMLAAQFAWHQALGTPHLRTGLIASFCFASLASGFNWFAMQRGILLSGPQDTTVTSDMQALPRILLAFLLAAPRAVLRRFS